MGKNILTKELLLKSVKEWNRIRAENPDIMPDLREEDLIVANLSMGHLVEGYISKSRVFESFFCGANYSKVNLSGSDLRMANLRGASLRGSDLSNADLCGVPDNLIEYARSLTGKAFDILLLLHQP